MANMIGPLCCFCATRIFEPYCPATLFTMMLFIKLYQVKLHNILSCYYVLYIHSGSVKCDNGSSINIVKRLASKIRRNLVCSHVLNIFLLQGVESYG